MKDRRQIIDDFATFLNQEMQDCIAENIDFSVLAEYKKIMLLQSAPLHVLQEFLKKLYQQNECVEVIIVGQNQCEELRKAFEGKIINLVKHDKAFGNDDFELMQQAENGYNPDAVVYFNNFASCVDFSNVEHLLWPIEGKLPIYSYSYVQKELNKHKKLLYHLYGCIVYKDLLEWFRTFN